MKKRVISIIVLIASSLFCNDMKAQIGLFIKGSGSVPPQYFQQKSYSKAIKYFENNNSSFLNTSKNRQLKPKALPLAFSVETLPFFCKIEHKMGINQTLPIKFRLGDVQYVDELEGK